MIVDLSTTFGYCGHQIIRQNIQKLVDHEKAIFENKDLEALHQLLPIAILPRRVVLASATS
ncbi:MAG: hypothetical protein KME35_17480 [Aphanocapsa sp. GSE-SYN-MK-11-07L]|jgi:CHAD domain-containing protein|nr:hypothetical protein [Aphanocapsa sp. GSE-SYN-MK-11-07L]